MSNYISDIPYWVNLWNHEGEVIPTAVARTIADYWAANAPNGTFAAFARGEYANSEEFEDDIASVITLARSAGAAYALTEVLALKDWALHHRF